MPKITPFLWFDKEAAEASNFYVSVFKSSKGGVSPGNSKIGRIARYGDVGPGPKGSVMTVEFEIDGQKFVALNGGPLFPFTEAVSFEVNCETQAEVDYFWTALTAGGKEVQCGWLKDKFGLSWQIVPTVLNEMMADTDPEKAKRVTAAMLKMIKLDIAALKRAYEGK